MSRGCTGRICGGRFVVLIIARRTLAVRQVETSQCLQILIACLLNSDEVVVGTK